MRRLVLFLLLWIPLAATAQVTSFDGLYTAYGRVDGVETHTIGRMMISAARLTSKEVPAGLESVRVVAIKDPARAGAAVVRALEADVRTVVASCTMITQRTEEGTTVRAYAISRSGDRIRDIIIHATSPKGVMVMLMKGQFASDEQFLTQLARRH